MADMLGEGVGGEFAHADVPHGCAAFAEAIGRPNLAPEFQAIRDGFATPEEINVSPQTAPSKRIESIVPAYNKPLNGNLAASEIGLPDIRASCPHFSEWLSRMESLASP